MNFLVTGGAGFIGSHLVERLLSDGHRVTILDSFNDAYNPAFKRRNVAAFRGRKGFTLVRGDVRDAKAISRAMRHGAFDQIIHLAARAGVRPSLRDPLLYSDVNIGGTLQLLEAARKHGIPKFIFGSSSSVYGSRQKIPFREDEPALPISPYAATKLAGEALCHSYHHLYGLDVACLRFFTVYGPRQRPDLVIYKFACALMAGRPLEVFGDGTSRRDYTFVDDIVRGIFACTQRRLGYEIINLGGSHTVQLNNLIQLLEKSVDRKARIKHLPDQLGDVPITSADVSKAKRLLGWRPKVRIEEGIKRFVEWFLGEHLSAREKRESARKERL